MDDLGQGARASVGPAGAPAVVGFAGPRPADVRFARTSRPRAPQSSGHALRGGTATVSEAIEAVGRGRLVLVVDDHDRENEGDLVMAAAHATPDAVNTMVTRGRGLVCLPLDPRRCDALGLGPMVPRRAGREETAFTVSIDLDVAGSTGISAHDRARTIRHAVADGARPADFRRPGHVFPLRARPGGVLERRGHTEAAVDLARLAGLPPAGVICEVMNPDGTMARLPELLRMAEQHGLPLITIADLVAHRHREEVLVERVVDTALPTPRGAARAVGYRAHDGTEHVAVCIGDVDGASDVLVRVHRECLPGDVFRTDRCDCGAQLDTALQAMHAAGRGVVVYTRGHGVLGHPGEVGDVVAAAHVLRDLGLTRVRLLTDDPATRRALAACGVDVAERVPPAVAPPHPDTLPTPTPIRGIA